jgi:deazaflavin-dependent oxidoreductase (nitroreductase family)
MAESDAPTTDPPTWSPGALSEPPRLTGVAAALSDGSKTAFRLANRYLMIPLHRAGLGAWFGSPAAGWQCLVTTTGRRSGLPRPAPLGYIVMDGAAWVMAGYGPRTAWYRNVLDGPRVTLLLPGRAPIDARAEEVRDPSVRAQVIPPLCRSMALPGSVIGCFPPISTDERILECVSWVPLVRIAPADGTPLEPGPDDPGGRGWIWRQALLTGVTLGLLLLAGSQLRRIR